MISVTLATTRLSTFGNYDGDLWTVGFEVSRLSVLEPPHSTTCPGGFYPDKSVKMPSKQPQTSLFQVYLRLRPPITQRHDESERFLTVEPPETSQDGGEIVVPVPTHVTLQPPSDSRKRAIERFGFTKVFEERASQLDIFHDTGMESLVRGVLKESRDGLVATLGVTGSGKV